MFERSLRFARLGIPLLLIACNDVPLDVRLHGPPGVTDFAAAVQIGEVTVTVEEADTGDRVGSGSSAPGDDAPSIDGLDLDEGTRYRVRVVGVASGCDSAAIAGRSLPFVHDAEGDVVDVYVACTGEAALGSPLPRARVFHATTWSSASGRAVVTGGAASVTRAAGEETFTRAEPSGTVYEMDVVGDWVAAPALSAPRQGHAAVELGTGVALLGGMGPTLWLEPERSVERLSGAERHALPDLPARFALPQAAVLSASGRVAVVGAGVDDAGDELGLALYDPDGAARAPADPGWMSGAAAVALAGGERVLLIGGDGLGSGPDTAVRLLCEDDCGCGEPPCVVDVTAPALPGTPWVAMAAVYVPCADASDGGAVVVAGGRTGETGSYVSRDELYCYRDEPGTIGAFERADGSLLVPRAGHTVSTVEELGGGSRVLVVGGITYAEPPPSSVPADAELLTVDGCTCDVSAARALALPIQGGALVGHTATSLGDGSVLIVGGLASTSEWGVRELPAAVQVLRYR